jgi:protein O-GlcNAc transferase
VLRAEPRHFEALHALGIVRYQGGQLEEAERLIGEAISVKPGAADANYNRACLLLKMNRAGDALCAFDRAIGIKPDYVEALVNRGTVLMSLERYREALADFDRSAELRPNLAQIWNNRGGALLKLKRSAEALASWEKALRLNPNLADAWRNHGAALLLERRFHEALESFGKAVTFDPNNAGAWTGRGHALRGLNRRDEAITDYNRALVIEPSNADALYHRGIAHFLSQRFEDAANDYRRTLEIDPEYNYARGSLIFSSLCCCDWRDIEDNQAKALAELRAGKPVLGPFECVAISRDPAESLVAARIAFARESSEWPTPLWRGERYAHEKIRIAYLSANFHDHAVSRLMAGVWEIHDRSRFETVAVSFGPDDGSAMRTRLLRAFERFVDVRDRTDPDVASLLRGMETDIAVDLMGYTEQNRPGILVFRPAPVQVNYLGFPGTMAADHIDYILGDRIVIPEADRRHYTEQVVYLPNSYLPNDSTRAISPLAVTRAEAGLPEVGFVFASFNNAYKFTPAMFDVWMRLLNAVDKSVLWVPYGNSAGVGNLRREAKTRGVDPERLVFAAYAPRGDEHLARLRLSDLFLDTLPYNAHAGACDALWAGVPVLTCLGGTFAGRVAASALHAVGLPELVTSSLADYEALALNLARDPFALIGIREKLARNRNTHSLFDTARFARQLEGAYTAMWERSGRGEGAKGFAVEEAA